MARREPTEKEWKDLDKVRLIVRRMGDDPSSIVYMSKLRTDEKVAENAGTLRRLGLVDPSGSLNRMGYAVRAFVRARGQQQAQAAALRVLRSPKLLNNPSSSRLMRRFMDLRVPNSKLFGD